MKNTRQIKFNPLTLDASVSFTDIEDFYIYFWIATPTRDYSDLISVIQKGYFYYLNCFKLITTQRIHNW